jgi:CRP-like cAMP-binding protein
MAIVNPALTKLLQIKNKINFFKGLDDDEISDLIFNLRFQRFEPGEVLFKEGDEADKEIYYLLSGSIDLTLDSKDLFLTTLTKPTLFGEMRSFIGEPRTATAKASASGAILISFLIKESKETQAGIAFTKFYKNVIQILARKIMEMNEKLN